MTAPLFVAYSRPLLVMLTCFPNQKSSVPKPERISQYRAMFAKQNSHGNFVVHLNCGIIAGSAPLHESEGMAEVDRCLNDILPLHRTRPDIMFFDKACVLDRYLDNQQDASWPMTRWIVDRCANIYSSVPGQPITVLDPAMLEFPTRRQLDPRKSKPEVRSNSCACWPLLHFPVSLQRRLDN